MGVDTLPFNADAIAVLALYICGILSIGIYAFFTEKKRKQKEQEVADLESHYLAGGGLGMIVLFFTLFASTFSGWTLMGMPGDAFRDGARAFSWVTSFCWVYLISLAIVPRIYRVARPRRYVTPCDFLMDRFDSHPIRVLSHVLMLTPTILYVLLQFKAMGICVKGLSGGSIDPLLGAAFLGVIMVIYESIGGMRGVAFAQVVQGGMLMICFIAFWFVQDMSLGGFGASLKWAQDQEVPPVGAPAGEPAPMKKTRVPTTMEQTSFMSLVLIMTCFPIYPHQMVRYFSATSSNKLRRSLAGLSVTAYIAFFSVLVVGWVSIKGHSADPTADNYIPTSKSDEIFGEVLKDLIDQNKFGYWLAVFLLCGAVAAMMSTADAGLMAVSSMITKDLVKPYVWKRATSPQLLVFSKILVGVTIVLLVIISNIDIALTGLAKLQQQILLQVLPAIWLGCHMKRLRSPAVLAGMVTGTTITIAVMIALGDVQLLHKGFHPGLIGFICNIGVIAAIHVWEVYLDPNPDVKHYVSKMVENLDEEKRDEPVKHPWVYIASFFLILLGLPFYRPTGKQDPFAGSVPLWLLIMAILNAFIPVFTVYAAWKYWEDEPIHVIKSSSSNIKEETAGIGEVEMEKVENLPKNLLTTDETADNRSSML